MYNDSSYEKLIDEIIQEYFHSFGYCFSIIWYSCLLADSIENSIPILTDDEIKTGGCM